MKKSKKPYVYISPLCPPNMIYFVDEGTFRNIKKSEKWLIKEFAKNYEKIY